MSVRIMIEDHVVPQLLTSAIEAYEMGHQAHEKGKAKVGVETYGLLWGYVLPERHELPARVVATMATVETSALRHEDWVKPNLESLKMKRDFFQKYWPHLELVGTFHSHPYDNLSEVNDLKGWRASDEDEGHWPWIHEQLSPELPYMAHLIVTVTALERKGWALPQPIESETGFVLSSDYRKFWIKGYASQCPTIIEELDLEEWEQEPYSLETDIHLDIPSLEQRFL